MLPEDIDLLIAKAREAMDSAIAPYSGFRVGASLRTDDGKIYTGCNIENPSLMLSFCAERVVLLKAITEGERAFGAMAIVSSDGSYCFPCGACRQMLFEFASDISVYLAGDRGIKRFSVTELLPHAFERIGD